MKCKKMLAISVLGLMVCATSVSEAAPMGTAFTYQGRLIDANDAADGLYDFQFKLFDANVAGAQQGGTVDINDLDVIDGYFTVELDFGSEVFDGNAVWLETTVAHADGSDPCTLRPRQEITPVPYALQTRGIFVDNAGNVGIGTTSPSAKLDVEVSSGGAATIGSSSNSATGDYAIATGYNTTASGDYSTAMGRDTIVSGFTSTAMGWGTNASNQYSTAMGRDTTANGYASTSMGRLTTASGNSSIAMGILTTASGDYSTAMGREIEAQGDFSVAIALNDQNGEVVSQNNTMAIMGGNVGVGTTNPSAKLDVEVTSGGAATIGSNSNSATGNYAVSMGESTDANNTASIAMGRFTTASGYASTAMGYMTNASGYNSTAMGNFTFASGDYSTAMGEGTIASGEESTAMGRQSHATGWVSTAMGYQTTASSYYSTAMGIQANASGPGSTAMGYLTTASGEYSTAMGQEIEARGDYSVAIALNDQNGVVVSQANTMAIMGGNVGIGTTSPAHKLVIHTDTDLDGIYLNDVDGTTKARLLRSFGGWAYFQLNDATGINTVELNSNGNSYFNGGNVGIGTTIPTEKLEVSLGAGSGSIAGFSALNNKRFLISVDGSDSDLSAQSGNNLKLGTSFSGTSLTVLNSTGNVGIGTVSPSSKLHVANGCITGSMCSDIRLKKNIEPLPVDDSILDRVMGLQAVTFEWKHRDDSKRQIGLIAQDVEDVFPEVVTTPDDGTCEKGLLATGMDAVLIEAIKELKAENELLKERLEALERKIEQRLFTNAKKI
jgi:hypothetical protein